MNDTEAVVGYLFLYLAREADAAGDPLGWATTRLYELVAPELGNDPALRELAEEARAGHASIAPDTLRRMALALVAASHGEPRFVRSLAIELQRCRAADTAMNQPQSPADEPGHLAGYVRFGGPENPGARAARDALASYLDDPQSRNAGLDLLHQMATGSAQDLGLEHPFCRTALHHVARFAARTGHDKAAVAAYEALISDCAALLGAEHPVCHDPGFLLFLEGEQTLEEGIAALDHLLTNAEPAIGTQHPVIHTARGDRDALRAGLVRPVPVTEALTESLADFLRVLGPGHPVILNARLSLAWYLAFATGPAPAAGAAQTVLVDALRALGPDHIVTRAADRAFTREYGKARFQG